MSDRLKQVVQERKLTQTELARRTGVTQSTVSDWVNKGALPKGATFLQLLGALRVSADWLLLGRGARDGGPPPAGQAYHDGGMAAINEMRRALEMIEQSWVGSSAGETAAAELADERRVADALERPARRTQRKAG